MSASGRDADIASLRTHRVITTDDQRQRHHDGSSLHRHCQAATREWQATTTGSASGLVIGAGAAGRTVRRSGSGAADMVSRRSVTLAGTGPEWPA